MATINLQCNSLSQVFTSGCKLYDRYGIHGRSADTSLAEIHEEMSELLDKQVNIQKESLKENFQGSRKPASP